MILSELGGFDLTQLLLAAIAVFIGGFLRGFVGFGGALVVVPIMALAFTPKFAVALHAITELPGIIQLLPTAIRHCDRKTVLPMILALVVSTPLGVYVLTAVDTDTMRIVISALVLFMVAMLAWNTRIVYAAGMRVSVIGGVIGGIIQGAAGIGGPPVVTLLLSRGNDPDTTRGNIVVMMSSMVLIALPFLWIYGLISVRTLILGGLCAPVYLLATYLGSRYFRTGGSDMYRVIALSILALTAASTLIFSLV
ncbi:MAG: sulfite exporter TauE/SafE family protein [Proteobacteria bacterium]|nr:sulfite exporter TauE/SafE family protein [Pseudomonadota bacterium]MDA1022594.1 sulfite exporter TauE/SafE family protein [Pseudomonadota bacterium]